MGTDEQGPNNIPPADQVPKFEFALHPSFAEWIDREVDRIAGLVTDVTDTLPTGRGVPSHPDLPIAANFTPDNIIGEVKVSATDAGGNLVSRFYQDHGRVLALTATAMSEAQKVAESIWTRKELRDLVSRKSILQLLLDHIGSRARKMPTALLSKKIFDLVTSTVHPVSVWIAIEELSVEGTFPFATAVMAPMTRAELDALAKSRSPKAPEQEVKRMREDLYTKWAGRTVMRFELTAEPKRAEELALERATDYMTLLQFYTAPTMILPLASHIAPRGARPYREQESIVSSPRYFHRTQAVTEPTYRFVITNEERGRMEQIGLTILSSLAQNPSCDYEKELLNTLLIYGRGCYQLDQDDKLLQIMTALEMFALRNDSEPIQAALADRLAFAIATDPGTRQQIARNLREAYQQRSGRTHHGRSIVETETIEQFLRNAWVFFLTAIRGVGRYRTRTDFLDHLDRTKYGYTSGSGQARK